MEDNNIDLEQMDGAVVNDLNAVDEQGEERDALTLDLPDDKFLEIARKYIDDGESFYREKYKLPTRWAQNETYLWGRQLDDIKLKKYEAPFVDNILYDSLRVVKSMSMQQLPDIVVKAAEDNDISRGYAADLGKIVTNDIQSRERKYVLGMAFKHRPVYFYGCIKPFWNPEKGKDGDYDFKVLHPEYVLMDPSSTSSRVETMDFVAEVVEYSVQEWVMRFPKREQDFYKELYSTNVFSDDGKNEKDSAGMSTKVKGWELWFNYYEKAGDGYEKISCVAWFYRNCVFDKMKNPYWDWSGDKQVLRFDKVATEEDMRQAIVTGDMAGFSQNTVFHNHFNYPKFPYIFLTYDQWGKAPIDETSELEQAMLLQKDYDKRGAQITEMLDRSRGKHVFSSDAGLTAEDVERMDMNNPDEDLLVKGRVNEVHAFIAGEQPSAPMIESFNLDRERIFEKLGANGPTRGQVDMDSAATNNQIAREGDFTQNDDVTDDTINYAAEEMANWELQFIKLFYTEEHFIKLLGPEGDTLFKKIHRDMVQDGMEITISASGSDKLKAQQQAMDMAKLRMTDPISYYTDMGMNDPKGRAEKLMLFLTSPNMYIQKFIYGNGDATSLSNALTNVTNGGSQGQVGPEGQPVNTPPQPGHGQPTDQGNGQGSALAMQDIMQIQQGQVPQVPPQVDPSYLQVIVAFLHSPQFQQVLQQYPQIKQPLLQWLEQVQKLAQGQGQQNVGQPQPNATSPTPQEQAPNGAPGGSAVGPLTGNPQPGNTVQIAAAPQR